ncbi:MAG: SDR family NAD(P)-dependent oxidoreductase, partial [Vicinamibacterales bacterium]
CGTVEAFVCPPPTPAPHLAVVGSRVRAEEFAGQRALVIGGSRGLGAAVVALVAAGGGTPLFTYATGRREARALERQIHASGRSAEAVQFDVTGPTTKLAAIASRLGVTHLYYCATPRIFARRRHPFDAPLFEQFARFYVDGFARVCAALSRRDHPLTALYPSTTAIDEPLRDLTEYTAAKAAGESLCRVLETTVPGLRILVRRLPRTATDQTMAIVEAAAETPVDVMLPIVRQMQQP